MRSVLALATIAFTASAVATPWGWGVKRTTSNCMSDSQAQTVANNFKTLIASYSDDFADQTLTTDFVDYSDSVIELINGACTVDQNIPVSVPSKDIPCLSAVCTAGKRSTISCMSGNADLSPLQLGSAVFDSRESFKSGQGAQPAIPFEILNLWNNCNSVSPHPTHSLLTNVVRSNTPITGYHPLALQGPRPGAPASHRHYRP